MAKRKRKRYLIFGSILVVVVVVVCTVVGVMVGLGARRDSDDGEGAGGEGSGPGILQLPTQCISVASNDEQSTRFMELRAAIASASPTTVDAIDVASSSARTALCWLESVDQYRVEVEEGNEYELIQRYALASIYFHFVAPDDAESPCKLTAKNWMSDKHVCSWDFTTCDDPDNNRVTDLFMENLCLDTSIPKDVTLLSDLVYLRLVSNELTGEIPSELSRLTQLQMLDLSSNELAGRIPSQLANLSQLRNLILGSNTLVGSIPIQIYENTRLEQLALGANRLTGTLSSDLGNTIGLTSLSIKFNFLTGTIPDLSTLTNLERLRIEQTALEGPFPNISGCTSLGKLAERLGWLAIFLSTNRLPQKY